jgi:DUF971 family protein
MSRVWTTSPQKANINPRPIFFAPFADFFAGFAVKAFRRNRRQTSVCDTQIMPSSPDPKSVRVNLTTGTGVDIEWKDGHSSHYSFSFLRDACPCALCDDERGKSGRKPGEKPKLAPGALPMFKESAKPLSAEGVGKYAIKFHWNDGHELGIYSWQFLRDVCPCEECVAARTAVTTE